MRRLTVVSVAYPAAPVGPDAVGGAEQVLTAIDRALVRAGHRSIVVTVEGSTVAGDMVTYAPPSATAVLHDQALAEQRARAGEALRGVLAEEAVDVVHMHGIDFHHYLPRPGPPVLATLHLPIAWYPSEALLPSRPLTWVHCVSATQAACAGSPRMLPPIRNGVPVEDLQTIRTGKRNYAVMMGRICPEKGQHLALEAARAAEIPLLIGGDVFPYSAHREYFSQHIEPLLDRQRRYLGPVGFARKRSLLARARCLLIPSLAAETSSLVAMEAASCGTPVIAFRAGALPEVVEHGRTGFVVDDVASMVTALSRIGEIDPELCRRTARERFTQERMTNAYIARYFELAGSAEIHAA